MLKQEITYEDYNGDTVTETLYFNLTKTELVELEMGFEGGLEAFMDNVMESGNNAEVFKQFKRILLLAYGQKSPDGKRFIKTDEIREEWQQTAAYDAFFMLLAQDEVAAATFIKNVIPKDMLVELEKRELQTSFVEQATPTPAEMPAPPSE